MQHTESSAIGFAERWQELREHHWLDLAEYGSIGISAIGSVAAGLSGQVVFAATPIVFSLALNVFNRHRIELQTRVYNTATIAELNQIVDVLQTTVESLPASHQFQDLEGSVIRMSETVANMEQFMEKTSPQIGPMDTTTIQKEFAVLRRAIMRLRDRTEDTVENLQESMNNNIHTLRQALSNVETAQKTAQKQTVPTLDIQTEVAKLTQGFTEDIQTEVVKLTQGFTELETQVKTPSHAPSALMSDIEPLQQQILQLQEQVCDLQQENQEVVKPYLKRLTRALKNLNKIDN